MVIDPKKFKEFTDEPLPSIDVKDPIYRKYLKIADWNERCDKHPDHQTGMISHQMLTSRAHEEADALRIFFETDVMDYVAKLKCQLADAKAQVKNLKARKKVVCSTHPKAPHGFLRDASHAADRYVCECEAWDPYDAGFDNGFRKALQAIYEDEEQQDNIKE